MSRTLVEEPNEGLEFLLFNASRRSSQPTQARIEFTVEGAHSGGTVIDLPAIGPGEALQVGVTLNHRANSESGFLRNTYGDQCCGGSIVIDPSNTQREADEGSNKVYFSAADVVRDAVRDCR